MHVGGSILANKIKFYDVLLEGPLTQSVFEVHAHSDLDTKICQQNAANFDSVSIPSSLFHKIFLCL